MRFVWLVVTVVVLASTSVACSHIGPKQTAKNDAAVQAAFGSLSRELKPGATRKEVKDYLRGNSLAYFERCCYEPNSPFSVLVKVGDEEKPWFCSAWPDYVAFEFDTSQPQGPGIKPADSDSDVLKAVHLTSNGEGCL